MIQDGVIVFLGHRVPWRIRLVTRPFVTRIVLSLARRVAPFDLETYLRVHFTNLSAQIRAGSRATSRTGQHAGLAVYAVDQLACLLSRRRRLTSSRAHTSRTHRSICVPSSTTCSGGSAKYEVALAALRDRNANSRSLIGPSSPLRVERNVSRPR